MSAQAAPALGARVLRGGFWLLAIAVTGRVVGVARLFVLARCLGPREFGLVGGAVVALAMLEAVSDFGLYVALVQRRQVTRAALDTAWTIGVLRGLLMAALMAAGAGPLAALFDAPEARPVMRVMALVPLLGALANIGIYEFRRELEYGRYYVLQLGAVLADLVVALPLALRWRSAWALVAGWLALAAARTALSYLLHPYRPRPAWDWGEVRALLGYGRWIAGAMALQWVAGEGVAAVVGARAGLEALALYQMAWRLTGQPAAELALLAAGATLAAYAKLQDEPARVLAGWLQVLRLAALLATPALALAVLWPEELVALLLGARWSAAAAPLQILAAFAWISLLSGLSLPLLQGLGAPQVQMAVSVAEVLVLAAALWPLLGAWGLRGAALAVLLRGLAGSAVALGAVVRRLGGGLGSALGAVAWPAAACLPFLLVPRLLAAHTPGRLALAFAASGVLYAAGVALLDRVGVLPVRGTLARARAALPGSSR